MKELSGIEKMELVKATMEGLGFNFEEMSVDNAFEMFRKIKKVVSDTLVDQMETFERIV